MFPALGVARRHPGGLPRHDDPRPYPQNVRVGVMPVDGGEHRWISDGLDRTFEPTTGDHAAGVARRRTLLALAEDRGDTHLYELHVDGRAPSRSPIGPVHRRRCRRPERRSSPPPDLRRAARRAVGRPGRRASQRVDPRAHSGTSGWERFAVPVPDGTDEIDAWIMRPGRLRPTARSYPVLLNVHGGPHTQYGEVFFDEAQMQAAAGFVVLMSNPRGGSGRDNPGARRSWAPSIPVDPASGWGSVDVDDVLAVLDAALERYPFCDGHRVGMLGGSYGGYMATLLAGRHGDRFQGHLQRAGGQQPAHRGVVERHRHGVPRRARTRPGRGPRRVPAHVAEPVRARHPRADAAHPLARTTSAARSIRPRSCGSRLRLLGRDVTFYRFPGEDHELSRSGSPMHRCQRAEIILDWFAEHLA